MPNYDYERTASTKTAGGSLASESMQGVMEGWMSEMMKVIGDKIPKNLTVEGVRFTPLQRSYLSVTAKGYSKGDIEAEASVALDFHSGVMTVTMWYKDAYIGQDTQDFKVGWDDASGTTIKRIQQFFDNR